MNNPPTTPLITVHNTSPAPGEIAPYQPTQSGLATRETLDISINEDTLVSILVSKGEKAIRARIGELNTAVKAAESEVREAQFDHDQYLEDFAATIISSSTTGPLTKPALAALCESLSAFAQRPVTYVIGEAAFYETSRTLRAIITIELNPGTLTHTLTVPATSDYLSLRRTHQEAIKALDAVKRELLFARQALNNIDSLERQARATIAENVASRTEQGKALVDQLTAQIDVEAMINQLRM
jgi:hypothetical protein